MDAAQLGSVGAIVVGLAAAGAAIYGHRAASSSSNTGAVLSSWGGLVNELQEERADLRTKLTAAEGRLSEAYADLAQERADRARLENEIAETRREIADLQQRLAAMGGPTT